MRTESGSIRQAGTVPYRWNDGRVEFCLVTSSRTGRWGLPKGNVEVGDDERATALQETWEEAGLRGELEGEPLGRYEYRKRGRSLSVLVYLMRVTAVLETWPEQNVRRRRWVRSEDSPSLVLDAGPRGMLEHASRRLQSR